MKHPTYRITIDEEYSENGEDLGISAIAFTSRPAILTKGFAFSQVEHKEMMFKDDVKYRIAGPIMIPMEIYRCDNDEEYYVQFTANEIEKMHKKFMSKLSNKNVFNIEHQESVISPSYVLETILVDSDNKIEMIKKEYSIDVPLGTSFFVAQVTDKDHYNDLVAKEQTGFSIEGFLGLKLNEIKQKHNTMNNQTIKFDSQGRPEAWVGLPVGVSTIADTTYTVEEVIENEGTPEEYKHNVIVSMVPKTTEAALAEQTPEEIQAEKDKATEEAKAKEELATDPATETPPTDTPPVDETKVENYTKEEVDAKFEEVYKLVADLKTVIDEMTKTEETEDAAPADTTKMSATEKLATFSKFSRNNKVFIK